MLNKASTSKETKKYLFTKHSTIALLSCLGTLFWPFWASGASEGTVAACDHR